MIKCRSISDYFSLQQKIVKPNEEDIAVCTLVTAEVRFHDPVTESEKIVCDDDDDGIEVGKEGKQSEN